ncbi:MAG: translation initiation factor 2 [Desulfovibrio sp.]|nr:translation initiation factor 2 [Desulfovibrio sp.]
MHQHYHACFSRLLICCALCLLLPMQSLAADYAAKKMAHYARDMEFYYLEQRPEVLPGMLRAFDREGGLAQGEKRLMLAAFLATLLRSEPELRTSLLPPDPSLSHQGRYVLAWMAHLADLPDRDRLVLSLLGPDDTALLRQIEASPRDLHQWDLMREPAVQQMYWGAFMASGSTDWLDSIIRAAMRYGPLNAAGRRKDSCFTSSATAAAALYEWAPRHTIIGQRLEYFLKDAKEHEAAVLRTILRR